MKVLHINTVCGFGSTGNIAMEIANHAISAGNECYVAYAHADSTYPNSIKFGGYIEQKAYAVFDRLTGMQGLFGYASTKELIGIIEKISPDIIHIHNIHGNTLYFPTLFRYIREHGIKVVWTLHDCWSFTGGCTHFTRFNCHKYQTECKFPCPNHHSRLPWGKAKRLSKVFSEKRSAFTSIPTEDMRIVTVSNWLNDTVKGSFLGKYDVSTIYNWINTDIFQYRDDAAVYERYGLDRKKKYLVSVSALWSDASSTKLKDALRLAIILSSDYQILLVGNIQKGITLPENITHITYVDSAVELSKLYSIAFAYVNFSIEDTFGKVIAEAMACGTPTVVFDSTACGEVVGDVGHKVPAHDVEAIVSALQTIEKNGRGRYSAPSVEFVKANYVPEISLNKYIDIYKSLLES